MRLLNLLKNYEQSEPLDYDGMEDLYEVLLDYKVRILDMDFRRDCNIIDLGMIEYVMEAIQTMV
jgi:hypothetical protein